MQTVKVKDILNAKHALENLAVAKGLPVKVAYRIAMQIRKANPILEEFGKARFKKAQELGESAEEGQWKIKPENAEKYEAEMMSLLEEDAEILDAIELPDDCTALSAGDLMALEKFVTVKA